MKRVVFLRIDDALYRRVRVEAAKGLLTIQEFGREALNAHVVRSERGQRDQWVDGGNERQQSYKKVYGGVQIVADPDAPDNVCPGCGEPFDGASG